MSIRLRLTLWYSAVLLLGLCLFGTGMWLVLQQRLYAGIDVALQQRVHGLKTTLDLEGALSVPDMSLELSEFASEVPEGALMQLRDDRGNLLLPTTHSGWIPVREGFQTISREGHDYRILSAFIESGGHRYNATVASDLHPAQQIIADFRYYLLLTIPGILLLAGIGGYSISRVALAPVDQITQAAKSISLQNLSQRLDVPKTHDELQRMSEAWNDTLARLDKAVGSIRQFTADASHELRTPVALVRATAELALRRERTAAEYRSALTRIVSEAERMTGLTENLLALARLEDSGLVLPLKTADISCLISEVVAQAEAAASQRGIIVAGSSESNIFCPVNEPAFRRLLLILIDNALKHTPCGGQVTVRTERADQGVLVEVSDTGEGIPPEVLPHIFERFYTGDPVRASGSGAGLGLAIARSIAHAHQGSLTVASEPGLGSHFYLRLKSADMSLS